MFTTCVTKPQFWQTFYTSNLCIWGVGAVLSQPDDTGQDHPVAYFSKKFLPREEQYSTVEKRVFGYQTCSASLRSLSVGRPFKIQTDHRALVWLDRLKENNARFTRWNLSLQPYVYSVCHCTGKEWKCRCPLLCLVKPVDAEEGGRNVTDIYFTYLQLTPMRWN